MPQAPSFARVDVIIPTYRPHPGMLAEAVASARSSPLVARIIIIDDGSDPPVTLPDDPPSGPPAEILRQPNAGPAAARNRGLSAATAPWILMLDDDDLLIPKGLAAAIDLAEGLGGAKPAVGALAARIERTEGAAGASAIDRLKEAPPEWAGNSLPNPGAVFRPTVLFNGSGILLRRATGGPHLGGPPLRGRSSNLNEQSEPYPPRTTPAQLRFNQGLFVVEDREFLRRLADLGPIAISPEPMIITRRRPDGSNLTGGRHLHRRIRGHVLLLRKYLDPDSAPWLRAQTTWLLNTAAKGGVEAGHWRLLAKAAHKAGWPLPLKARLRRLSRPKPRAH